MTKKRKEVSVESLLDEERKINEKKIKQLKKECLAYKKEREKEKRQARLRGEYTQEDLEKDLAILEEIIKQQNQR